VRSFLPLSGVGVLTLSVGAPARSIVTTLRSLPRSLGVPHLRLCTRRIRAFRCVRGPARLRAYPRASAVWGYSCALSSRLLGLLRVSGSSHSFPLPHTVAVGDESWMNWQELSRGSGSFACPYGVRARDPSAGGSRSAIYNSILTDCRPAHTSYAVRSPKKYVPRCIYWPAWAHNTIEPGRFLEPPPGPAG
jgi:hypothetical protein